MDPTEARELLKRLRKKLAESPLPVSIHAWRNVVGAALAAICAVAPHFLLQSKDFEWMFVVPISALTASVPDSTWSSLAVFTAGWPFAEIRVLGWLFLPAFWVWYSVALQRATDGKLDSTFAREMEHLEHEAQAAEAAMGNINQPPGEAQKIAKTLRSLEPKQRFVRRAFMVHRHDLGLACLVPWVIAAALMTGVVADIIELRIVIDLQRAVQPVDVKFNIPPLWTMGSIFFGGPVVYAATFAKSIRGYRMQTSWSYIGFIRDAVNNAGKGGGAL